MKPTFDLILALAVLLALSPLILVVALLVFLQDRHSPFFIGPRVGKNGRPYRIYKFRSMVIGAHKLGAQSTAGDDGRITPIGSWVRRFKLDEIPQLFNVVLGEMSFVGPRPNVASEVALYSEKEKELLTVRPGITDYASIVFADEGDILKGSSDPDRDYNLLIRPWKSRLALHYVATNSLRNDIELMWLTALMVISRDASLRGIERLLRKTGATDELIRVSTRAEPLVPSLPPGVTEDTWEDHLTYT